MAALLQTATREMDPLLLLAGLAFLLLSVCGLKNALAICLVSGCARSTRLAAHQIRVDRFVCSNPTLRNAVDSILRGRVGRHVLS
jgi:hypothetical protein